MARGYQQNYCMRSDVLVLLFISLSMHLWKNCWNKYSLILKVFETNFEKREGSRYMKQSHQTICAAAFTVLFCNIGEVEQSVILCTTWEYIFQINCIIHKVLTIFPFRFILEIYFATRNSLKRLCALNGSSIITLR